MKYIRKPDYPSQNELWPDYRKKMVFIYSNGKWVPHYSLVRKSITAI